MAVHLAETVDNALVNIGAGAEFSIREFARLICDLTGYDFERIQFDTAKYVGARSKCLSVDKLRVHMPNRTVTPLRLGLERTIDWFRENSDRIDGPRSSFAA